MRFCLSSGARLRFIVSALYAGALSLARGQGSLCAPLWYKNNLRPASLVVSISFTTNPETSEICICGEPDDLDHYLGMLQSPELHEAMKSNGVIEDSVQLFILDKTIIPK